MIACDTGKNLLPLPWWWEKCHTPCFGYNLSSFSCFLRNKYFISHLARELPLESKIGRRREGDDKESNQATKAKQPPTPRKRSQLRVSDEGHHDVATYLHLRVTFFWPKARHADKIQRKARYIYFNILFLDFCFFLKFIFWLFYFLFFVFFNLIFCFGGLAGWVGGILQTKN